MAENAKLFVGQLPEDITKDEIDTIFGTYGRVTEIFIMDSKPPSSGKCAFVKYDTERMARDALKVLDNVYKFRHDSHNAIRVQVARSKVSGGGRDDDRGHNNPPRPREDNRGLDRGGRVDDRRRDVSPPRGQSETTVFVGELPDDIREDEIETIFSTYGKVVDVRIADDRRHDGAKIAFVQYERSRSSHAAVQVLHNVYKFRYNAARPIRVEISRGPGANARGPPPRDMDRAPMDRVADNRDMGRGGDNRHMRVDQGRVAGHDGRAPGGFGGMGEEQLFIGNLPDDIQEDEIQFIFSNYGEVVRVKLMDGKDRRAKAAFVGYADDRSAREALHVLNDIYRFRPHSPHPIRVEFTKSAAPRMERPYGGRGPPSSVTGIEVEDGQAPTVFVGQLPLDITEAEIETIFTTYGRVLGVSITDGRPGSNKIAFVDYASVDECRVAMAALNEIYKFRYDSEKPIRVQWGRKRTDGGRVASAPPPRDDRDRGNDHRERGVDHRDRGSDRGRGHERDNRDRSRDRGCDRDREREGSRQESRSDRDRDMNCKLHVGNLAPDVPKESVESVFNAYGPVKEVVMLTAAAARDPDSPIACFVIYEDSEDARRCVAAMESGYEMKAGMGNLRVKFATPGGKPGGAPVNRRSRPY